MMGLYFSRFNFVVTYYPWSKNSKADPLFHCHDTIHAETDPEPILAPSFIVAPIYWDTMEEIHQAQQDKDPHTKCPLTKLY